MTKNAKSHEIVFKNEATFPVVVRIIEQERPIKETWLHTESKMGDEKSYEDTSHTTTKTNIDATKVETNRKKVHRGNIGIAKVHVGISKGKEEYDANAKLTQRETGFAQAAKLEKQKSTADM